VVDQNDGASERDPDLIRKAQGGDLSAFEKLVVRYQGSVRAFAALRISMRGEAEDLAQEAFVIAWRKLGDFDPEGSFGSWVRTITHHLIRNHRRKFRAESVGGYQDLELIWREQERSREGDASDRLLALKDCLSKMDGPSLRLLNARYLDGMSVQELAAETGRGYSALTTQLHRLRELLAGCIEHEMEGDRA